MRASERTGVVAIVPCSDLDAAETWWRQLGFVRPADQDFADYRMLADADGGAVHLTRAVSDWLVPGRNPFGLYLYSRRVDELAAILRDAIIEPERAPTHKPWGTYEFAVNGPDDLLVRIGWPSGG